MKTNLQHILAIESSCDETAVAVVRDGRTILSSEVISQIDMHTIYGGVVPEIASRRHIEVIDGLATLAVRQAGLEFQDLDGIAVTFAPGLIGALLVGLNFAKSLAFALDLPLIPVHHIRGHVAANFLAFPELEPPLACLVASGGHTLILGVDGYTRYRILGSTRDDAAGETYDKVARVLGIGYPGGKKLDELAALGDDRAYKLPQAVVAGHPYDMSFSGLKTASINLIHHARQTETPIDLPGFAASFNRAVSEAVVGRVIAACKAGGYTRLAAAGGVAANARVRADLQRAAQAENLRLYLPPLSLCGDNAAMIGCQGFYEYAAGRRADLDLNAYATLEADYENID